MTTFKEIVLKGDQPTEQGIRAMEMVYEKLTGECWHEDECEYSDDLASIHKCGKCGDSKEIESQYTLTPVNPTLLTSLDSWRPLWERLEADKAEILPLCPVSIDYYLKTLNKVLLNKRSIPKPIHHLETALRTLEDTCPDCSGSGAIQVQIMTEGGYTITADMASDACMPELEGQFMSHLEADIDIEPCTCNDGKRTLYELWKEEIK